MEGVSPSVLLAPAQSKSRRLAVEGMLGCMGEDS